MSCDDFKETLLDFDWDEATRKRAAALLDHLASCPECRAAAQDFERLRGSLAAPGSDAEPINGWSDFERQLNACSKVARPSPWRLPLMALAASLIIAAVIIHYCRTLVPRQPVSVAAVKAASGPAGDKASLLPQKIQFDLQAFDQVSRYFDGHASWMLVSDGASDVGTTGDTIMESRKVLLLRLTLTQGRAVTSDADLLVVPGQTANLIVPVKGGQSLHYRIGTSAEEPTHLSLWLEIQESQTGRSIASLSTHLQLEPGQGFRVGQLASSAGTYALQIGFEREDMPADKL